MENFDYVILGAGLGGLSAAACLTRQESSGCLGAALFARRLLPYI